MSETETPIPPTDEPSGDDGDEEKETESAGDGDVADAGSAD